jgi:hypothetical protein
VSRNRITAVPLYSLGTSDESPAYISTNAVTNSRFGSTLKLIKVLS